MSDYLLFGVHNRGREAPQPLRTVGVLSHTRVDMCPNRRDL
ncbi:uncharacterized protein J3R85_004194 [Psidium guajava]|nr:uncharacterized protein J3R85_004194 [Psidium guajava]